MLAPPQIFCWQGRHKIFWSLMVCTRSKHSMKLGWGLEEKENLPPKCHSTDGLYTCSKHPMELQWGLERYLASHPSQCLSMMYMFYLSAIGKSTLVVGLLNFNQFTFKSTSWSRKRKNPQEGWNLHRVTTWETLEANTILGSLWEGQNEMEKEIARQ